MLIRYTRDLVKDDTNPDRLAAAYEFLDRCLRFNGAHSEMVNYEAARAVCAWPSGAAGDLAPAITTLHIFMTSGRPAQRFVAARTLSKVRFCFVLCLVCFLPFLSMLAWLRVQLVKVFWLGASLIVHVVCFSLPLLRFVCAQVAMTHPLVVAKCNKELEALIGDSNRTVATLAITTLLKTGGESSVDRLMKEIMNFMSEIGDEFKVVVVKAIHELCVRYPQKYRTMFSFLLQALREEGGYAFKKSILVCMIDLINKIPESKFEGLLHLCEFIEDCEFASLSAWVLHFIGDMGPTTSQPSSFIRYIYNRVILESAHVRAAAVSALTKFAVRVDALRPNIIVLLKRCVDDDDDEVRDRAAASLHLLTSEDQAPAKMVVGGALPMAPRAMTRSLRDYQARPAPGAFNFDALPSVEESEEPATAEGGGVVGAAGAGAGAAAGGAGAAGAAGAGASAGAGATGYVAELAAVPELAALELGPLFRSTAPVELTESELEYLVNCVRHIYPEHVVFQFNVTNTVPDQLLEGVTVGMQVSNTENWEEVAVVPAPVCRCNQPTATYVVLKRVPADNFAASTFSCSVRAPVCVWSRAAALDVPRGACMYPFHLFDDSHILLLPTPQLQFIAKDIDPDTQEPEGDVRVCGRCVSALGARVHCAPAMLTRGRGALTLAGI